MSEQAPNDRALNAMDMIGASLMFLTAIVLAVIGLFIVVPITGLYEEFQSVLPMFTRVVVNRAFPLASSAAITVMAMACLFAPAPIQRRRLAIMVTFVLGLLLIFLFFFGAYLPLVELSGNIE